MKRIIILATIITALGVLDSDIWVLGASVLAILLTFYILGKTTKRKEYKSIKEMVEENSEWKQ